jgi:hypothetical protein
MFLCLTRRQWLRSLLAAVAGFWAAGRTPAGASAPAPRASPGPAPAPAPPAVGRCRVTTYTYEAASRLTQVQGPWVGTFVYDGGTGRRRA